MRIPLGVLFLASISCAYANFAFSTIGSGFTVGGTIPTAGGPEVNGGFGGQNAEAAVQFSLSFDDTITQIDYVIATDGNGPVNQTFDVTLAVYSDNGGVPGSQVGTDSWAITGATTLGEVQSVAVDFSVTANTLYWLVAAPASSTTNMLWDMNDAGIGGNWAIGSPLNDWFTPVETTSDPAFALEDDSAPEPASGLLVLSAFAIAMIARRISSRPRALVREHR